MLEEDILYPDIHMKLQAKKLVLALLALVPVFSHAAAQAESDLRALILDALAAGQKTVTVPKGAYRLKAEHGSHLRFANLEDVAINATGVQLICEDPARAVEAINCRNLKIKGLSIDYDPLPYTQGEIVSVDIRRRAQAQNQAFRRLSARGGHRARGLRNILPRHAPFAHPHILYGRF